VRKSHGRTVDIETLEQFDAVAANAQHMAGWRIQGVDLSGRTDQILRLDPAGSLVLGGALSEVAAEHVRSGGGLVLPEIPQLPFDPYRTELYTPDELYEGLERGYQNTTDARVYAWSRQAVHDAVFTVARGLHDASVDEALAQTVGAQRAVGVMGGHVVGRDRAEYAGAAELGRRLGRAGMYVMTGGGPGVMEAANLGAHFAGHSDRALAEAIGMLASAPSFQHSITAWAAAAFEVRSQWPSAGDSLGIPTWFYGHEPPNPFATHIAKYFLNSLREDTLLRICTGGIVFLPGFGGTVQEIFQDACENYYAEPSAVAPMVLVGRGYWTRTVPAWPLLQALADRRPMARRIHVVEHIDEVIEVLSDSGVQARATTSTSNPSSLSR
jgi:predicted Rossmann-fold nucleotide-binding protein